MIDPEAEAFVEKVKAWVLEIRRMRSASKVHPKQIVTIEFTGSLPEPKDEFVSSVEWLAKCKLVNP
jgi:valyl-tRNA synthetase